MSLKSLIVGNRDCTGHIRELHDKLGVLRHSSAIDLKQTGLLDAVHGVPLRIDHQRYSRTSLLQARPGFMLVTELRTTHKDFDGNDLFSRGVS